MQHNVTDEIIESFREANSGGAMSIFLCKIRCTMIGSLIEKTIIKQTVSHHQGC